MLDRALSGVDGEFFITYKPNDGKEESIDLWPTMREYTKRIVNLDTPYHAWSQEDKARYAVCCEHANAEVIKDARFIIVTANNAGAKVVRQNFGTEDSTKFIAVICDEEAMVKESDQWIALTKLTAHRKITVIWLVGDHNQLVPLKRSSVWFPCSHRLNEGSIVCN